MKYFKVFANSTPTRRALGSPGLVVTNIYSNSLIK